MAKRFTATEKWQDPWFCGLSARDRIFWLYLLDACDHAGIWQVNWPLVKFYHGSDFEFNADAFGDRVVHLSEEKWFIPKFIKFQYGELQQVNRAHASVIAVLKKEGVWKGLTSPLDGDKDKDKDTDKDKVKVKDKGAFRAPTVAEVAAYCKVRRNNVDPQRWHDHYSAVGWKVGSNTMKDWQASVRTWEARDGFKEGAGEPERLRCPCGRHGHFQQVKSRDSRRSICADCREQEDIKAGVL